tara:strand:- start:1830 stop:2174 length:345 start_codon:yes stop_codon:yes gene_type:complete
MKETQEGRYLYTSMDALNDHLDSAETIQKFFEDNAISNKSDANGIPESTKVQFDGINNIRILRFYEPMLEEVRTVVEEFGEMEWPAIGDQPPKKITQWHEPDSEWAERILGAFS